QVSPLSLQNRARLPLSHSRRKQRHLIVSIGMILAVRAPTTPALEPSITSIRQPPLAETTASRTVRTSRRISRISSSRRATFAFSSPRSRSTDGVIPASPIVFPQPVQHRDGTVERHHETVHREGRCCNA